MCHCCTHVARVGTPCQHVNLMQPKDALLIQVRSCAGMETSAQLSGIAAFNMPYSARYWCVTPRGLYWLPICCPGALHSLHSRTSKKFISSTLSTPHYLIHTMHPAALTHLHPRVPLPCCLRLLDDGVRALALTGVYWYPCCCCQLEESLLPHVGLGV